MRKALASIGVALALGVVTQQGYGADDFEKPIKARKALMQVYAFNLGILGAMAKGQAPYDAKLATEAAENLLAAAQMKNSAMWPKGSDAGAPGLEGETRAKSEIWTEYPKVSEKGEAFTEAAMKMAAEAGDGLDAVKANMGAVGKSCKGCHEPFRVPKKN